MLRPMRLFFRWHYWSRALWAAGAGFFDFCCGGGELGGVEGDEWVFGQGFEVEGFDFDAVGVAFVELDGEQAFERAFVGVVVDELGGGLAVDEVLEAVPLGEDNVFVPLADIDLHGRVFV